MAAPDNQPSADIARSRLLALAVGLGLGAALGVLNLFATARQPLANDEGGALVLWAAAMILMWSAAAWAAARRTHRFADAIATGAIAGVATVAMFHGASIVRVNVFLDVIRYRADWQNLVARFNASRYGSL